MIVFTNAQTARKERSAQKLSAWHDCNISASKLIKVTQFSQWFVHNNKVITKLSYHVAYSSNSKYVFVTNGVKL